MSKDYIWLNKASKQFLQKDYLLPGQTVDERVTIICDAASKILGKPEIGAKFQEYFKKGWYSLSSPIWTNFGTDRGLPVSCFGSYISDDSSSILSTQSEVSMMSKYGGGTSAYFGKLRPRGAPIKGGTNGQSGGAVQFMKLFNSSMNVWSQGSTRRGEFAAYLDIDHPDIMEFLTIKSPGSPIQDISFGVCVTDEWLHSMKAGNAVKRKVWAKVLESRNNTGYPYIIFIDNMNAGAPDVYREMGFNITHSNLCSEIALPDGPDESFVCDLSSMNILYYDDWKDMDAVEVLVYILDAVLTEFINKASSIPFMERAVKFARSHRAIGIGWLGWHSYLQSRMISFESMGAKLLNIEIAKNIKFKSWEASRKLASEYGQPVILKEYGRRNTTLTAIAPTKSSSFIIGQASEGIEPIRANYYIKDLAKGKFTIKNSQLEKLLKSKDLDTDEVWSDIMKHGGSVQHLSCLNEHEKNVFKTFSEISPMEIIIQAAGRQKYIDQSQSLNLIIDPKTPIKDVNALILKGWELGIKSFYYQINQNAAQQLTRNILNCASCES